MCKPIDVSRRGYLVSGFGKRSSFAMMRPTDEPLASSTRAVRGRTGRVRAGPRGRNLERMRRDPKPNDEFAPSYETCLQSKVSEGVKRQIKGLASKNWVKRVIKGQKPKRSPVWTSIHNDWKRPSYTGLAWSSPTFILSRSNCPSNSPPPAPRKLKKLKKPIPFSRIPSFPPLFSDTPPPSVEIPKSLPSKKKGTKNKKSTKKLPSFLRNSRIPNTSTSSPKLPLNKRSSLKPLISKIVIPKIILNKCLSLKQSPPRIIFPKTPPKRTNIVASEISLPNDLGIVSQPDLMNYCIGPSIEPIGGSCPHIHHGDIEYMGGDADGSRFDAHAQKSIYSDMRKEKNRVRMRILRNNPEYRQKEKEADNQHKKYTRSQNIESYREADMMNHRKMRQNIEFRTQERERDRVAKCESRNLSKIKLHELYFELIKEGPNEVCSSCKNLWFKRSMKKVKISNNLIESTLEKMFKGSFNNYFCCTCSSDISKGKIPRLYTGNGLEFCEIPKEIKGLTELEERLVSPRIPFMQIRPLGVDLQKGLKGAVVNIPIDINTNVSIIPRNVDDHHTIAVSLMRKMEYKRPYLYEVIRPNKVIAAAKYLSLTPLYQEHGIAISNIWNITNEYQESFIDSGEKELEEEILNPGGLQTLLCCEDNFNVKFAPGEGKTPLSVLFDDDSEELSFPSIYCGVKRNVPTFISYNDIAKSEARRSDRRCCNPQKMFYTYKKMELLRLRNNISLFCRQGKTGTKCITAKDILDENSVENLIMNDNAYRLLQNIRSSPPYWQEKKKEVMSMIRQLGIPTFFMTLSAAETQWPELLKVLKEVIDGEDITLEEASNLQWTEKARLIQSDPITCSRYFDNRIRTLIYKVLMKPNGPFNGYKIIDYYYRIEFQHRGSPHVHCILWLENAPSYRQDSTDSIVKFIDNFITTDKDKSLYSKYQMHKHTHTCYSKRSNKCRFGIPFPPMNETLILEPLPDNINKSKYETIYNNIINELNEKDLMDKFSSKDELLKHLDITEKNYILAIRSQLKNAKIFLKRDIKDIFVNPYNDEILNLHRANMDLQYILDPYACISYIVNYVAKAQRGMSLLLRNIIEQSKAGKISIKEQLKTVANTFVNCSEISAQEVAYHLLSMPMSVSSRSNVYINTALPNNRVRLVKSKSDLEKLNNDSDDIFVSNMIEYYTKRPLSLESICLAEFVAWYNYNSKQTITKDDNIDEDDIEMSDKQVFKLLNCKGSIVKRTKAKVIRYRRFNEEQEPDEYFREMLMLFMPWRNEQSDLIHINHKDIYNRNLTLINSNRKNYIKENIYDYELPDEDISQESNDSNKQTERIDVIKHIANKFDNKFEKFSLPKQLCYEDYKQLTDTLNCKQSLYHKHIIEEIKQNNNLYEFVTGPAGAGKSQLIKAIYQSSIRLLNSKPGSNPEQIKVLLAAPTGRAAFSIGGVTLHGAFQLPVSQCSYELNPLSSNVCNSLRSKLNDLKLIIIDEISMVGSKVFAQIDSRLRQIFRSNKIFGGISIVAFGDLRQLRPVCDRYLFQNNPTNPFSELIDNHLWSPFKLFELTEIMRQKDDQTFAEALQRLSKGQLNDNDIKLFKSREVDNSSFPPNTVHLFLSNKEVDCHNIKAITLNKNIKHMSVAYDCCVGDAPVSAKEHILNKVSNFDIQKTGGLRTNLTLKCGIKYMITCNIDVSDGLVNGAIGTLQDITYNNQNKVSILWLKFNSLFIGSNRRKRYPKKFMEKFPLTPIVVESRNIDHTSKLHNVQVIRKQFPLTPAEAITIHKSQGDTILSVAVHIAPRMSRNCLYVALSRATSLNGLYVVGKFIPPSTPSLTDVIELELVRLKQNQIDLCPENIYNQVYTLPTLIDGEMKILENNSEEYFNDLIIDNYLLNLSKISKKKINCRSCNYFLHIKENDFKRGSNTDMYKNIEYDDYELLIYPICIDSHWVMVAVDIKKNTLIYFDSKKGYLNINCVNWIIEMVKRSLPEIKYDIIFPNLPQQSNGYDCGLYVCTYARNLCCDQIGLLTRTDISKSIQDMN